MSFFFFYDLNYTLANFEMSLKTNEKNRNYKVFPYNHLDFLPILQGFDHKVTVSKSESIPRLTSWC